MPNRVRASLRTITPIAAVAALTFLAGCGGTPPAQKPANAQNTSKAAPTTTGPMDIARACSVLDGAAVGKVLGQQGVKAEEKPGTTQPNGGRSALCEYTAGGKNLAAFLVTVYPGNKITPPEMIKSLRTKFPKSEDVAGVGEGAVWANDEQDKAVRLAAAKVVKGDPVLATLSGPPTSKKEQFSELVKAAVDKLV